ncbi:hypothetical protein [Streptomyces sp. NPDC003943]
MGATKRRGRRWIWILVGVAVVLSLPLAFLWWAASFWDDVGKPQPVDCAEAMSWAGATLPKSAEDAHCTEATWLDTMVDADFRMPRAEVAEWLAGTWPAARPTADACLGTGDLCLHLEAEEDFPQTMGGPAAVDVRVTYENADTALVSVSPFTV